MGYPILICSLVEGIGTYLPLAKANFLAPKIQKSLSEFLKGFYNFISLDKFIKISACAEMVV
jgi:hypothetical protein